MKFWIFTLSLVISFSAWAGRPGPDENPRHQPGPDEVETEWNNDRGRGDSRPDYDDDRGSAGSGPWDDWYGSRDSGGSTLFRNSDENKKSRQYGDQDLVQGENKRRPQYGENDPISKQQGDGHTPPKQMQRNSEEPAPGNNAPDYTDREGSRGGVNGPDGWTDYGDANGWSDSGSGWSSPDGDYGSGVSGFLRSIFGCSDLLFAPSGA